MNNLVKKSKEEKELSFEDVKSNKDEAIKLITSLLDSYMLNPKKIDKANKFSYWLKDYSMYLSSEETFNPLHLKEYKRGDIVKVNLGYNIDKELGGLHYCVVLDNKNSKAFHTITVIPLTSIKPNKEYTFPNIVLGNELYKSIKEKRDSFESTVFAEATKVISENKSKKKSYSNFVQLHEIMEDLKLLSKIEEEIKGMKSGSIANVNQIRTISKMRIYNPRKNKDILSGIKLSEESLALIDTAIIKAFTNFNSEEM